MHHPLTTKKAAKQPPVISRPLPITFMKYQRELREQVLVLEDDGIEIAKEVPKKKRDATAGRHGSFSKRTSFHFNREMKHKSKSGSDEENNGKSATPSKALKVVKKSRQSTPTRPPFSERDNSTSPHPLGRFVPRHRVESERPAVVPLSPRKKVHFVPDELAGVRPESTVRLVTPRTASPDPLLPNLPAFHVTEPLVLPDGSYYLNNHPNPWATQAEIKPEPKVNLVDNRSSCPSSFPSSSLPHRRPSAMRPQAPRVHSLPATFQNKPKRAFYIPSSPSSLRLTTKSLKDASVSDPLPVPRASLAEVLGFTKRRFTN